MSNQVGNGRPQHFSAWSQGAARLDQADASSTRRVKQKLILAPIEDSPKECFKVLVRPDGSEYFLLENRTQEGLRREPAGRGAADLARGAATGRSWRSRTASRARRAARVPRRRCRSRARRTTRSRRTRRRRAGRSSAAGCRCTSPTSAGCPTGGSRSTSGTSIIDMRSKPRGEVLRTPGIAWRHPRGSEYLTPGLPHQFSQSVLTTPDRSG